MDVTRGPLNMYAAQTRVSYRIIRAVTFVMVNCRYKVYLSPSLFGVTPDFELYHSAVTTFAPHDGAHAEPLKPYLGRR